MLGLGGKLLKAGAGTGWLTELIGKVPFGDFSPWILMHFCRQSLHFASKTQKTRALKQNYYLAKVHLGSHFWRRQRRPERRHLVGWESFEAVRLCQSCQMLRMYSYVWGENLVEHRVLPNQATEGNICTTVGFSAQTSFISYVELSTFFSRSNLLVSSIFNSVNGFSLFSRLSWG